MTRAFWTAPFALTAIALLTSAFGQGGGPKPVIPAEASKVLTERSIQSIEQLAKANAEGAREKINVEAAILAGYTIFAKNAGDDQAAMLRGAALGVGKMDLKALAKFGSAKGPKTPADIKLVKVELNDLMAIFFSKAKKGEGIHPDLHYQPKLKNLNGIEALVGALAAKKLTNDNMAKVAGELPNLAYRIGVVGAITEQLAPKKGAGAWRELSIKMRDASFTLAEAAKKKDANGVFTAAQMLDNTCTTCHSEFKGKVN